MGGRRDAHNCPPLWPPPPHPLPPEQHAGPSTNTASSSSVVLLLAATCRTSDPLSDRSPAWPNSKAPMAKPPQTAKMTPMLKVITTSIRAEIEGVREQSKA